jgi:hypothetical protein
MIHPESRSIEWLKTIKAQYPTLDIQLIEKTIRAFSLLESLVLSGCPFVFKGGTAAMLHLNSQRRVSIDIDIICPPGTDITQYLRKHSEEYGFKDVVLENRISPHNVPKTHSKFFYQVTYVTNHEEDAILLDVLFEDIHYGKIEQLPIRSIFLKSDGEDVKVNIPSAADILGDKLTAFAPHTTGIPFFKGTKDTTLEVVKQMYDVASLIDIVNNFELTAETYFKFANVEKSYRGLDNVSTSDILHDTITTALCLSLRGIDSPSEFELLQRGVKRIFNFIHTENYNIDCAIRDAAKSAYLAAFILSGETEFKRYQNIFPEQLKDITIGKSLNTKLNKLKKTNPEAFFYWAMVDQIL